MAWPPTTHQDVQDEVDTLRNAARMVVVGTAAAPITDAATARPAGAPAVYWMCAAGVTPTNAVNGDMIWNA